MPENEASSVCGGTHGTEGPSCDHRVAHLLREIERNPGSDLAALARTVRLSRSRLSHLFKRQMGCSLHNFTADRRMERSAQLLQKTETPVKEISYIVGYRHAPSFVRAFRKKFGCTPNDYRNHSTASLAQR
jgi:AraC family transcriptional regulator of arabinose operon